VETLDGFAQEDLTLTGGGTMPNVTALRVNGTTRKLDAVAERTLLSVLREDLKLTGTKFGCGEGRCAACTVLLDGLPAHSCVTSVGSVGSKQVTTIEGLEQNGKLHPVQEAFMEEGAYQCGYCTSGMIVATVALLDRKPNPADAEIVAALNGHLCRCCGYPKILNAVRRAAAPARRPAP
jgi:aerobic-type carbon monoxide dehydrogenase small subunit (CoxS/CutS family)